MRKNRTILNVLLIVSLLSLSATSALAQGGRDLRPLPASVEALQLGEMVTADSTAGVLSRELVGAVGPQQVVIRLSAESAAGAAAARQSAQIQRDVAATASAQQDSFLSAASSIAPVQVLARLNRVLNAVVLEVDASALAALAAQPGVVSINRVRDYELDLSETVPYIGATPAVQAAGFRGHDVRVAVLDSGIDYTHVAFGGAGTAAAYTAAYGTSTADARNTTLDGLFPTARVVGGYDFVGEVWPNGALAPDPDPIDCGAAGLTLPATCAGGHGTHVADIIGGAAGVAPEVDLYAVKICSAVSTSCSGVALLQGMEFAVDPNGDGDLSDHVNIVNMSLGSSYGQSYEDDLSAAVDAATPVGVLTVASAGNSADKPYIVGTPSAAYTALSVAQTTVPSDKVFTIVVNNPPAGFGDPTIGMIAQPWAAPLASAITAPVFYDTTNAGTRLGCSDTLGTNPWVGTPLAGRIVLIDRGSCAVTLKVSNARDAGAIAAIVANNTSGSVPPSFSFGGGTPNIPAFTITQAAGLRLRTISGSAIATGTMDPAAAANIVGSVVGTSSRGPNIGQMFYGNNIMYSQLIKPEIGAPGASVSAIAGAGTGTEAFGGTSGAAPMVSGAAALLMNATNWQLSPFEIKSRLMNTAERQILNTPAIFGGELAPITRIGGGEVRIDRAVAANAAAWEFNNRGAALSFGFVDAFRPLTTVRRTVVVRNYGDHAITYTINPTFRFANDAANAAVSPSAPASIRVPARSQRTFRISLTIDAAKLREWGLNSGALGANSDVLTTFEYDGYLLLTDASNAANNLSLPWHVLPRLSGDVRADRTRVDTSGGSATVHLNNRGAGPAYVDSFSLLGTSENLAAFGRGENVAGIDLKAVGVATFAGGGTCGPYILQFAVSQWERQTHAEVPGEMDVYLDTNRDGVDDFVVFNADFTLNFADGRVLSWVANLRTGVASANFYVGHATNSSNIVLTICASQLADPARPGGALPAPALGQLIDARVEAYDNYFTGLTLDDIKDIVFAPAGERYLAFGNDVAPGATEEWTILDFGAAGTNPSETGVLLLLDGARGAVSSGAKDGAEAIVITVKP